MSGVKYLMNWKFPTRSIWAGFFIGKRANSVADAVFDVY